MRRLTQRILREGLDDWVALGTVEHMVAAEQSLAEPEGLAEAVVAQVRELVEAGLVEVGQLSAGGVGFIAWHEPLEQVLNRIAEAFRLEPNDRNWVCWLSNTPAGDRIASESILGEEA